MQEIKKGWKKVRIGELTEVLNGGTPSTTECDYWDGNILWFTPKDLSDYKESKYISNSIKKITDLGLKKSSAKIVPKNSIILSSRAPVGYVNIITEDFTTNQGCKSLICNDLVNNQFLYYWLKINTETLENVSGGATFKELRTQSLKDLEILLPPLPTQQKIASILSKYDDLIENNNKRIKILEETAQSIYEEWFVKYNFPGSENIKMIDSGNDDFGMIPEGWEVKKFGIFYNLKYGKTLPKTKIKDYGLYSVYGAGGIIGFYDEKNINKKVSLITCRGNGSGTVWRTIHHNSFVTNNSFIVTSGDIEFPFILEHLKICNLKSAVSGSAQPQLTIDGIKDLLILVPNIDIINKYNVFVNDFYNEIDNLQKQNQNLKETRDLLIPRLVSGELDVENLDVK